MDRLLSYINEGKEYGENTHGILMVSKDVDDVTKKCNEFDSVILIISKGVAPFTVRHFNVSNETVEVHEINQDEIKKTLITGNNRRLVDWLLNGRVIFEKNEYITRLQRSIAEFPIEDRKYKMTIEFSKLIRRYVDGNKLFVQGHFLDAFNSILHSLHHLARLSVIEHGYYPEVTVWDQVKQTEPEIYKLYHELVVGEESLEKRLELLLIANNFALTSKTKIGASHLLELMKDAGEALSIEKLSKHNEVSEYATDLVVLVDYLVQKGFVDIVKKQVDNESVFERLYIVK
ncbi:hypothetical protein BKP35_06925 [Anaerobacillus arseniciselenatis]|uniref:Nucleotidyltransferase-like domain-containing protein n=1 Tax=Anaerobacillus arseniciselenatis TaxID=85682 RepID=A0A1S2LP82_9BACI|nr:nucleotidyltransferase-like protein [Anaerobacillus arseniciselenatis]OIJ14291.1 hypothetical protein BKP35_06925 [Anaerobacillus arseniciselenatis]